LSVQVLKEIQGVHRMRVLFLPNWDVRNLEHDDPSVFEANKLIRCEQYWWFKHWPDTEVDVIDINPQSLLIPLEYRLKIYIYQAIKALIRQKKYSAVISHSYNSGFFFSLIRSCLGQQLPPHFVIDVGCLNGGAENKYQIQLLKLATSSVAGLIYHSKINEKFYEKYCNNIPKTFIRYGTDPNRFKSLSVAPSMDYILSIGYDKRDYDTLLRAAKYINYPIKIVGKTNLNISELENVTLIPKVNIEKLMEYIHHATLVILPITEEPYSVGQMTLTQCMNMGKCVICSRVPGIIDYVQENESAILYTPGDANDLAKKVNYLLSDRSLINSLAYQAKKTIETSYNECNMAKEIYSFISNNL